MKDALDYHPDEIRQAAEICRAFGKYAVDGMVKSQKLEAMVNAHEWTCHLGNAAQFLDGMAKAFEEVSA